MAMFDDPKKELKKLEAQLLKEEEWLDKELEMAKALIGDEAAPKQKKKPVQNQPAQQTRKTRGEAPAKPVQKSKKEAPAPKKKSNKGLVILACLETLGIVGIVAYWMLFLL